MRRRAHPRVPPRGMQHGWISQDQRRHVAARQPRYEISIASLGHGKVRLSATRRLPLAAARLRGDRLGFYVVPGRVTGTGSVPTSAGSGWSRCASGAADPRPRASFLRCKGRAPIAERGRFEGSRGEQDFTRVALHRAGVGRAQVQAILPGPHRWPRAAPGHSARRVAPKPIHATVLGADAARHRPADRPGHDQARSPARRKRVREPGRLPWSPRRDPNAGAASRSPGPRRSWRPGQPARPAGPGPSR